MTTVEYFDLKGSFKNWLRLQHQYTLEVYLACAGKMLLKTSKALQSQKSMELRCVHGHSNVVTDFSNKTDSKPLYFFIYCYLLLIRKLAFYRTVLYVNVAIRFFYCCFQSSEYRLSDLLL